jgi:Na+/proline symporter/signal transduction histidine kinase/ActR/RegA family two-component response regulator
MLSTWGVIFVALGYVGVLFAIAAYGDRSANIARRGVGRPYVYALSLAVYCTSWTFYGSVGLASTSGFDFLPIYLGPILLFGLGWPLIRRIVSLSKSQNITSIADFLSARYGKNQLLGGIAAFIAVIAVIPYISLQLKAVSLSLNALGPLGVDTGSLETGFGDVPMFVAIAMAIFAMLFGTRHADATEHQNGLILSVAAESVVKLIAFLVVGAFITFAMMGGPAGLFEKASNSPEIASLFAAPRDIPRLATMTFLAFCAVILLPRQFHLAVVENTSLDDVRKASWMFPLYLVAINIFVIPIAIAGLITFSGQPVDSDTFVLALPVADGQVWLAMFAFLGGLSAATAMVIVETIALSIMVCNSIVVPLLLRNTNSLVWQGDMTQRILQIRRAAIGVIIVLAYSYYLMIGTNAALAQTGLVSFAAVAQFAPAFFFGLIWNKGNARGAMAALAVGFGVWFYTLLAPLFADAGWLPASFINDGPMQITALRPQHLFGSNLDPLTHGVLWSMAANIGTYLLVSLQTRIDPVERMQAHAFVPSGQTIATPTSRLGQPSVTVEKLQSTVERYLGRQRTMRSFGELDATRSARLAPHDIADQDTLRFSEKLLASAIGTASARVVMALLLQRDVGHSSGAMRLLDDASDAISYNRDLLQSAIDHVEQGIAVFDHDLALVCWNTQFRNLLNLPQEFGRVGVPLGDLAGQLHGEFIRDSAPVHETSTQLLRQIVDQNQPFHLRGREGHVVLEVRSNVMPDDGRVVTFADITERVHAAEALEKRVEERTIELTTLNAQLEKARAVAVEINAGKTRFIAAASHDILQPLNAARLFTSSLIDRTCGQPEGQLVRNVDQSLEAVEEILSALLDMSRLDAGAIKPDRSKFAINDILNQLRTEFSVAAEEKQLRLTIMPCHRLVHSDRRLIRRILQNLLSNAIKYTSIGRVLMGCRVRDGNLSVEVHDTGPGIPHHKKQLVFEEFERLEAEGTPIQGLGLGLSIVERMARVLGHKLLLQSEGGKGCVFRLEIPIALGKPSLAKAPRVSQAPLQGSLAGLSVLVVDNEDTIIDGMTTLLEGWGCAMASATTAGQVRRLAEQDGHWAFDVVLMDFHLGRDNGLELIAEMRARTGTDFHAALITAERSAKLQEEAEKAGVTYLRKPVKPAVLRTVLMMAHTKAEAAE